MRGPAPVTEPDPAALTTLWSRVTRAGGAVGFAKDDPIEEIAIAAGRVVEAVRTGRSEMLAMHGDTGLLGAAVITIGQRPVRRHNLVLDWLMIDPGTQGNGWGRTLLAAAEARGAELGATTCFLATRTGHGVERFYTSCGWSAAGSWPRAVRLSEEDYRDEIWFVKDLQLSRPVRRNR